jgi:endonuclease/exonuclease/phosphatase family metal-dependent hydrolase
MPSLRLIAWNCHHGTLSTRLSELAEYSPDIVFLQECAPAETLPPPAQIFARRVGPRKAVALGSLHANYHLAKLASRAHSGRAVVAAAVTGSVSFTALGIWSQGPRYADDVMRTLHAYAGVLRSGPAVVMGDLNSGTNLNKEQLPGRGHSRIVGMLADFGLVSAYHAFHHVEHGHETHATYRHQYNATRPWHIDFCFVPARWVEHLVAVDVIDGKDWALRSDHLPLTVDLRLPRSVRCPAQPRARARRR